MKFHSNVVNGIKLKIREFFKVNVCAITQWLRHWILSPRIPGSKPMDGAPRLTQPFILPRSMILVAKTCGDLVLKNKLFPSSGSASLRQLNPIHKNRL